MLVGRSLEGAQWVALHKQNNNDGEIESETNEKMIRKTGRNGHLWNWEGSISFALVISVYFTFETEASENQHY